jgi:hypothetical protein
MVDVAFLEQAFDKGEILVLGQRAVIPMRRT